MRGIRSMALLTLACVILLVPVALDGQGRVMRIDYPEAPNTWAMGINAHGDIVGYYGTTALFHGFVLDRNGFSSIDYPGACRTDAWAINEAGDIVGTYNDPPTAPGKACSTGVQHGYLLRQGVFTRIDVPGSTFSGAFGINAEGDIVGHFGVPPSPESPKGRMNGFLLRNGTFTTYAYPLAETADKMTCGMGINSQGDIVGHYQDSGNVIHGLIVNQAGMTTYDVPTKDGKSTQPTQAYGINAEGEVVGFYTETATNKVRGFVLDKWGGLTPVDVPGAVNTLVKRNNARGDLVGNYSDSSGIQHGFLIRR